MVLILWCYWLMLYLDSFDLNVVRSGPEAWGLKLFLGETLPFHAEGPSCDSHGLFELIKFWFCGLVWSCGNVPIWKWVHFELKSSLLGIGCLQKCHLHDKIDLNFSFSSLLLDLPGLFLCTSNCYSSFDICVMEQTWGRVPTIMGLFHNNVVFNWCGCCYWENIWLLIRLLIMYLVGIEPLPLGR